MMRGSPWLSPTVRVSTGCGMIPNSSVAAIPMRDAPKSMPRAGWGEARLFFHSECTIPRPSQRPRDGSSLGYDSAGTKECSG